MTTTPAPVATLNDAHCHFFSAGFFETLAKDPAAAPADGPRRRSAGAAGMGPAREPRRARGSLGG